MKPSPVYLFYGNEPYLIQEKINQLINSLLSPDEKDFNVVTSDLSETPVEEVIQEAETLPFLSEHKLVIAKNAELFTSQKTKKVEHQVNKLEQYLEQPVSYSTIIFWAAYEKLDERKKIVKNMKKQATVLFYTHLIGEELLEWVKKITLKYNVKITNDAAEHIILMIGQNLHMLSQEIDKMALYVGKDGIIDEEVVKQLAARTTEQNIFTLIEKVGNLQIDEAMRSFYDLLKNKEEPIKMNALFARQFRMMMYAKELHEKGYSEKQIAIQLSAHPYSVKIALKQAVRFNKEQLQHIIKKLAQMDYEMKSGMKDKVLSLEMFLFFLKGLVQR